MACTLIYLGLTLLLMLPALALPPYPFAYPRAADPPPPGNDPNSCHRPNAGTPPMTMPAMHQPNAAEQGIIAAAPASQQRCACRQDHDDCDAVTPATIGRIRGYLTAHPGHQIAIDEDGILAIIALRESGPPDVLVTVGSLGELLDGIGAPAAESLS